MKKLLLFFILANFLLFIPNHQVVIAHPVALQHSPPAVLLFIGDGMGEAQRTAARWYASGLGGKLAMDLAISGWSRNASADNPITESAAAATAMATGVKTNNRFLGKDPAGEELKTILEIAQDQGLAVGLVTTVQVAHATPAGFAAHITNRDLMVEIAAQMADARINVLLGGGEDEFIPSNTVGCYPEAGERGDGRNLIIEAVLDGYVYVCNAAELAAVDPQSTRHLLGLFSDEGMPRSFTPSLVEMTDKAIAILSQDPDGFFLMVEGGQIDWAGHENDATNVIGDTFGFDEAVQLGLDYAATNPNALVIVTADHETGGMSVSLTSSGDASEDGPFFMPDGTPFFVNWTKSSHTGIEVPTTAQGYLSKRLNCTFENTYIFSVMRGVIDRYGWRLYRVR